MIAQCLFSVWVLGFFLNTRFLTNSVSLFFGAIYSVLTWAISTKLEFLNLPHSINVQQFQTQPTKRCCYWPVGPVYLHLSYQLTFQRTLMYRSQTTKRSSKLIFTHLKICLCLESAKHLEVKQEHTHCQFLLTKEILWHLQASSAEKLFKDFWRKANTIPIYFLAEHSGFLHANNLGVKYTQTQDCTYKIFPAFKKTKTNNLWGQPNLLIFSLLWKQNFYMLFQEQNRDVFQHIYSPTQDLPTLSRLPDTKFTLSGDIFLNHRSNCLSVLLVLDY